MQLRLERIGKQFGRKQALEDVTLTLESGMYGLLGRNGAGKSTLMKILATVLRSDTGKLWMNGKEINDVTCLRRVLGYLPQEFALYPNMKAYECLDYLGVLSRIPAKVRSSRIEELLEQVNLTEQRNIRFKSLSGGMKRRLGIAQALLNNPQLLIVDEPTVGLDPEERIHFRNLLVDLAGDRIVLLSTHIAKDIETTCERIGILKDGRLIYDGDIQSIVETATGCVYERKWSREEYENNKSVYTILNTQAQGKSMICRVLSDTKPSGEGESVMPSLEDGYIKILKEGETNEIV